MLLRGSLGKCKWRRSTRDRLKAVKSMATTAALPAYVDRVIGTILGGMVGDVLGAAVEGMSAAQVLQLYPQGCTEFIDSNRGYGCYTDDTEMTLALALTIVQQYDQARQAAPAAAATAASAGGACALGSALDPRLTGLAYGAAFDPMRGYGGTAQKVLSLIVQGADPAVTGDMFLPGGSFANGGAMRIAPVGLAFRNAAPAALHQAVVAALQCTHTHPEGVAGALAQAAAVAWLQGQQLQLVAAGGAAGTAGSGNAAEGTPAAAAGAAAAAVEASGMLAAAPAAAPAVPTPAALLAHLRAIVSPYSAEMDSKLAVLQLALPAVSAAIAAATAGGGGGSGGGAAAGTRSTSRRAAAEAAAAAAPAAASAAPDSGSTEAGSFMAMPLAGRWGRYLSSAAWAQELRVAAAVAPGFQIRATDAVAAALWALCCHWGQPEDAVVAAVHYGGDTDTVAAMAGALAGALHGRGWIPERWSSKLENGPAPVTMADGSGCVDSSSGAWLPAAAGGAAGAGAADGALAAGQQEAPVAQGAAEGASGAAAAAAAPVRAGSNQAAAASAAAGHGASFQEVLTWQSTRSVGRDAAVTLAEALAEVDWQ